MSRNLHLSVSVLVSAVAALMWAAPQVSAQVFVGTPAPQQFSAQGQPSTRNGEWPTNGADLTFSRYSPLDQINAANFDKLEVAWRFKTDAFGPFPEYKLEGTPLMVKGVLYTTAGTRRSVVALDGKTGELIWAHSLREGQRAAIAPRQLSGRGVSYWTDGRGDDRLSPRRAEREERRDDPLIRQGRHRRSEGRDVHRHRQGHRSRHRRSRP